MRRTARTTPCRKESLAVDIDPIALVSRWLHIVSAITVVGATIYTRVAVLPAADSISADQRRHLQDTLRSLWNVPVHAAILFLLVSGLYNIYVIETRYEVPSLYHALFGIKFLLALVIFYIAISLSGRSKTAQRMRENARFWLTLNMLLAITLVCISGVLRVGRDAGLPAKATEPAQPEPAVQRFAPSGADYSLPHLANSSKLVLRGVQSRPSRGSFPC